MSGYANAAFDGGGLPSTRKQFHPTTIPFQKEKRNVFRFHPFLPHHPLIFACIIFFAFLAAALPVRAGDEVVPELADVIMSLQVVSGIPVSCARDVTNDGMIDMADALYSILYMVRLIWFDSGTELVIAETLEEEVLASRDTSVTGISAYDEDALARAIVEANEADLQSLILFNSFYMAGENTPAETVLNRYRAMAKSFEIAEEKCDEIVTIHNRIEAADVRTSQHAGRTVLELDVDPKLQWYIDNYGKTTPGGHRIDVKTIAERNKISVRKAYSVLKTHYGVVAEQETAKAMQYEAAEKTAEEIKAAADTANTALSFVAGGQAALGVFKAAQTIHTTAKMFQAGTLGYRTADYILRTQGKNIVQGVINGGFSIGDGIMGVLTNPAVEGAFGSDWQANLNTAKTVWSGLSIAKGLTYDGYCLLSVKDAFTGQGKLIISNLTDFTKTAIDTTGQVISILQNDAGGFVQAVQRPENPFGESVINDVVYKRLSPETMLPNGDYVAKDENETERSFTVTASKVTTLLPNLSGDDLLINESGDIKEVEPPPYEHCCGWDVDFTGLTVYDYGSVLFYQNASGQKHGPFYEWIDSSRTELYVTKCYYEDMLHGSYTKWYGSYEGGIKYEQYYYNMDKLDGAYTSWHDNGNVRLEGNYDTGVVDGLWTWWGYDGNKEEEAWYSQGTRHGLTTVWWENGNKQLEVTYREGDFHGPRNEWYEDGTLKTAGQFTDGKASGIWIDYKTDGSCWYRYDHDNGEFLTCE